MGSDLGKDQNLLVRVEEMPHVFRIRSAAGEPGIRTDPMMTQHGPHRASPATYIPTSASLSCRVWRSRDVFNEKPATDELVAAEGGEGGGSAAVLPRGAVVHTTRGDVWIKLFPDECPKTVENFTTHARNGYYDGVIFHRVIKGFMIQTGDPLGARNLWSSGYCLPGEQHTALQTLVDLRCGGYGGLINPACNGCGAPKIWPIA